MKKIAAIAIMIALLVIPVFAEEMGQEVGALYRPELRIDDQNRSLGILYGPDSLYTENPNALQIVGIFENSPAHNVLHVNDYITHIEGEAVNRLGYEEASLLIESGEPVTLTIQRNGKNFDLTLQPEKVNYTPDALVESIRKVGRVIGFESRDFFRSNLTQNDGVKTGDTFIIFDTKGNFIGRASVNQVYCYDSFLRIIETVTEINTSNQSEFRLVYEGYYPNVARALSEQELNEVKKNHRPTYHRSSSQASYAGLGAPAAMPTNVVPNYLSKNATTTPSFVSSSNYSTSARRYGVATSGSSGGQISVFRPNTFSAGSSLNHFRSNISTFKPSSMSSNRTFNQMMSTRTPAAFKGNGNDVQYRRSFKSMMQTFTPGTSQKPVL